MALIVDTETTGLDSSNDALVELVMLDEAGRVVYESLFNPGRSIPTRASLIHGITDDMVRGAPRFRDEAPKIRRLIERHGNRLIAFNAQFDAGFLRPALPEGVQVDCAMALICAVLGRGRVALDAAARAAGHTWTGDAHRAKADAEAALTVWRWASAELGRQPFDDVAPPTPRPAPLSPQTADLAAEIVSPQTAVKVKRLADLAAEIARLQAEENTLKSDLLTLANGNEIVALSDDLRLIISAPKTIAASTEYFLDEAAFYALSTETRDRLIAEGAVRPTMVAGDGYQALKPETRAALEARGVIAAERLPERVVAAHVEVRPV